MDAEISFYVPTQEYEQFSSVRADMSKLPSTYVRYVFNLGK